ncbi:hypothetical protein ACSLBF_14420 [Pseudoalteromonas sp. T1lg65]|uniref:hypothetical protein n=1 Tax=Pseudoalteromonas sp. T1lg65 TaxID=2077101 RepID=UPI003F790A70
MATKSSNFLLVDSNGEFSQELLDYLQSQAPQAPSDMIIAGDYTRQMLKMMFKQQVKDYYYCDFSNEISVTELASYLLDYHVINGVLLHALDYQLASREQKFIFNSLHPNRFLVDQTPQGYTIKLVSTHPIHNHLTCHSGKLTSEDKNAQQYLSSRFHTKIELSH